MLVNAGVLSSDPDVGSESTQKKFRTFCSRAAVFPRSLLCVAFAALGGCSTPAADLQSLANREILLSSSRYETEYLLRSGDVVEVFVYQYPDFSRKGMIRPDGMLTLPVLDDITAAGLSPSELDDMVTALLSERIRNPEVTVFVDNIQEPMVYVLGEVGNPMAIPLRQASNLSQALTLSAGVRYSGSIRQVAIIRLQENGYLQAIPLSRDDGVGQTSFHLAMRNTPLEGGDLVFVPESGRSRFTRAVQDFLNTPLGALNQVLSPYLQIRLIEEIEASD